MEVAGIRRWSVVVLAVADFGRSTHRERHEPQTAR
jgi:hypothetical protein